MLIIATSNPAKYQRYVKFLEGIETVSKPKLEVIEGANGKQNAELKAVAYATTYGLPALGIDEELFLDFTEEQPGAYIRRMDGKEVSDKILRDHYLSLIQNADKTKRSGRFRHNVCLALPSGKVYHDGCDETIQFTADPPDTWKPGYPIGSLISDRAGLDNLKEIVRRMVSESNLN